MKDKTITVSVPDFCPEDCEKFKLYGDVIEYYTQEDCLVERHIRYCCKHEDDCQRLYTQLKKRETERDEIEVDEPVDDEDAVTFYKVKDALPGACFHGEVWHRCPYCDDAWEAMGATYKDVMGIGKTYKCEKCGRIMRVR